MSSENDLAKLVNQVNAELDQQEAEKALEVERKNEQDALRDKEIRENLCRNLDRLFPNSGFTLPTTRQPLRDIVDWSPGSWYAHGQIPGISETIFVIQSDDLDDKVSVYTSFRPQPFIATVDKYGPAVTKQIITMLVEKQRR
jgi:hypothetical protein